LIKLEINRKCDCRRRRANQSHISRRFPSRRERKASSIYRRNPSTSYRTEQTSRSGYLCSSARNHSFTTCSHPDKPVDRLHFPRVPRTAHDRSSRFIQRRGLARDLFVKSLRNRKSMMMHMADEGSLSSGPPRVRKRRYKRRSCLTGR